MCEEPAGNSVFLMGVNDNPWDVALSYKVTDVASDDNRTVAEGSSLLPADSAVKVALLDTAERSSFFLIEWECEGEKYRNHYVSWEAPFDRDLYLECAKKAGLL